VKKVKDFILREIADEHILIPTGSTTEEFNGIITLSETGAFIWEHLEEVNSFDELVDKLMAEYEVEKDIVCRDVEALLNEMLNAGMIALTDTEKKW